jgi:hypothetical protein
MMKANYEFLFVGKDESSFLENYYYDVFQDHGEQSGQIFVTLELQNNPVDAEEVGAAIFESMQAEFFAEIDRDPYERFELALKAVNNVLREFKAQKSSGYIGNLNVIVAVIVGDQLHLSQCGDAEAYLIRKRYVSLISDGLHEESTEEGDTFSSIASGQIEAGDFVLFASTRLVRYISKTDLANCVSKKNVDESLAELKDAISTEILGRVALTGITFAKMKKSEVEELGDEVDSATRGVLESNDHEVSRKKETLSGKFITAFKGYKGRSKTQVYQARSGFGDFFKSFGTGLFSKGFGKDKILAGLIGLIIVLVIGVVIASGNQVEKAELERLDKVLVSVQDKIAEAETKASYDRENAQEVLDLAYVDAKSVLDSGYYRDKATMYLLQIEETRDLLNNVQRIDTPAVLADLSQKRSDINALGFAVVGERVFVYEYNALYEVVLDQVQDPLTIDEEEEVIAATGFDDRGSVVFLTKSGKLIEYKDGTMSFKDTDDSAFRKGVAIADWSNKIYLLDAVEGQVWKYTYRGNSDRFSAAEPYVSDDTDLTTAVDVAIDGSVYVLEGDADIAKFYAGAKAEFYLNNAPVSTVKDPQVVYTSDTLDEVYVLDGKEARVLVYSKDSRTGNVEYKEQLYFKDVGELRDLYVDPDTRVLYVLTADKIIEHEL